MRFTKRAKLLQKNAWPRHYPKRSTVSKIASYFLEEWFEIFWFQMNSAILLILHILLICSNRHSFCVTSVEYQNKLGSEVKRAKVSEKETKHLTSNRRKNSKNEYWVDALARGAQKMASYLLGLDIPLWCKNHCAPFSTILASCYNPDYISYLDRFIRCITVCSWSRADVCDSNNWKWTSCHGNEIESIMLHSSFAQYLLTLMLSKSDTQNSAMSNIADFTSSSFNSAKMQFWFQLSWVFICIPSSAWLRTEMEENFDKSVS